MTIPPRDPEVILTIAGEGGGYTILGEQHQGNWRFWREAGGGDSWMYDDDEVDTPALSSSEPELAICYCVTIEEALEKINSGWPQLHPVRVHRDFAQDIWNLAVRFWRKNNDHRTHHVISKWSAICINREITSLDEI